MRDLDEAEEEEAAEEADVPPMDAGEGTIKEAEEPIAGGQI